MDQNYYNSCINTTESLPQVLGGFSGNIVPHSWYSQITSESGKPYHNAISIFSEIVYWYRPSREGRIKFNGDAWQTSYEHFENKFGYHREKTRRALVKLEELGLIKRDLRTIKQFGQKYSNVLFIRLLSVPDTATQKTTSYNKTYHESLSQYNDFDTNSQLESEKVEKLFLKLDDGFVCENTSSKRLNSFFEKSIHRFATPSPQICGEHYIEENKRKNNKNRSDARKCVISESSFSISSDLKNKDTSSLNVLEKKKKTLDWPEGKELLELATLSKEEVEELNNLSSREFSQNFVNLLVLKLGYKNPDHKFFNKKSFMKYMVKAMANEIIQAPQANNIDFKFACIPQTEEKKFSNRVNEYAEEVESSTNTLPDMLLKKKILGRLDPHIAYEILTGTSIIIDPENDLLSRIKLLRPLRIEDLKCRKASEIPEWIKQIILEEVRVVYGNQEIELGADEMDDLVDFVIDSNKETKPLPSEEKLSEKSNIQDDISVLALAWQKTKDNLREIYGKEVYKTWFSRLILSAEEGSALKIEAPTNFISSWVKQHYGSSIEMLLKRFYSNVGILEFM